MQPAKRFALIALIAGTCAIAAGYASAFLPAGTPSWGPWLLAFGIPSALGGIMMLGAARERAGIGKLAAPFAFVIVILVIGFSLALALPGNESTDSPLFLGLPLRAAIVVYGIGLLPAAVLPLAYALTFESQTLSAEDVERVRELGKHKEQQSGASESS